MKRSNAILLAAIAGAVTVFTVADAFGESAPQAPEAIAVTDEGADGYAIRHFPSGLHVYTFDRDRTGVSVCVDGCASAWPPVRAQAGARPVGDWTLVSRRDGPAQWAYKGKPVYLRYHDAPGQPSGDGVDGEWRIVGNIPKVGGSSPN